MDELPPPPPRKPRDASATRAARLEREAAALRENLRKRKEQARARLEPDDLAPSPGEPKRP